MFKSVETSITAPRFLRQNHDLPHDFRSFTKCIDDINKSSRPQAKGNTAKYYKSG